MIKKLIVHGSLILSIVFLFSSCGSSSNQKSETTEDATQKVATDAAEESIPEAVNLTIEGNDLMQFNTDKLEATEGQTVTLTLKHTGQMSGDVMGHNWVLLATGTDVAAFGGAAVAAKDNGYIPADMAESVIANTETIGGGEVSTVTFTAPKAGYYTFICSFPGHYGVMQGTFVSSPR